MEPCWTLLKYAIKAYVPMLNECRISNVLISLKHNMLIEGGKPKLALLNYTNITAFYFYKEAMSLIRLLL